jgi:hypothetical protein
MDYVLLIARLGDQLREKRIRRYREQAPHVVSAIERAAAPFTLTFG